MFAPAGDRAEELAAPMLEAIEIDAVLMEGLIKDSLPKALHGNLSIALTAVAKGVVAYLHMAEAAKHMMQQRASNTPNVQLVVEPDEDPAVDAATAPLDGNEPAASEAPAS